MKYAVRELEERVVVAIEGEIDLDASPELRDLLLGRVEETGSLHVELGGVTYIDSSGIATLVEAFQAARRLEREFALVGVSAAVARVLELARLDQVFTVLEADGGT
jgi:anti-sigma B factor antagonist